MNKELLNVLIKRLESDIDNYIGDYGTINERIGYTLTKILYILKIMNGEMPFEDWYLEEILGDKETPKGFKSYEDYKKKEEAFINHFCKGDKE